MKTPKDTKPPKDKIELAKLKIELEKIKLETVALRKSKPIAAPKANKPTDLDLANSFMQKHERSDILYRYGASVVVIADGKLKTLSNQDLACDVREEFPKLNKSTVAEVTSHVLHTRNNTLKRIDTFTTKPVFVGPSLELVTTPGFANGVYYEPPAALAGVVFREDADLATAQASLEKLKEPLKDFPFAPADDEDGGNIYLSMLLTLLLRPAIGGIVPCFFMRGNSQSLGKGLLCDMASLIIFGECAASISEPKDDSEWQSRTEAILMSGQQFCVIDNVVGNLNAPFFASVLTSQERNCRILCTSQMRLVPMNTVFSVNGNNVETGSDLEERVVMICLEHPDARNRIINDFHIQKTYNQSPDTFVKERRAEFLQHLVNLVCGWKNAGSPPRKQLTMSKYRVWESIVGGIFDFVEPQANFLSSNNANRAEANVEDQEMIAFIEAIRRQFPKCETEPVTVSQLMEEMRAGNADLCDNQPDVLLQTSGSFKSNRLGKVLKDASTINFDGYKIQIGKAANHVNGYCFVDTKPERHPQPQPQPQPTQQITNTASDEEQWIVNNN